MVSDTPAIEEIQKAFCRARSITYVPAPEESKLGYALSTKNLRPINGLRHPVVGDTNGWYIWCGAEFSDAPDFFSPLHAEHVHEGQPGPTGILGLAPGYGFLLDGDYLDIWYDQSLLEV